VSADAAAQVDLELRGVRKAFSSGGRTLAALRGVSLAVGRGRVTGLIGPDGAGKTTLMRLAVGLLAPDEGRITALGHDANADPQAVQASVGYMPQRFGLYEDLTVQENLDLYADLQGVAAADRAGRYGELMRMTGLARFTGRLAGRLSGGMKQKLGLACTLVRPPRLLLLDEPTAALDVLAQAEIIALLRALRQERGLAYLLVSHDLALVTALVERVAVMQDGVFVEELDAAALRHATARHPHTRELIEASRGYRRAVAPA